MAKISAKEFTDSYKDQEKFNSFQIIPEGTYHVVNTQLTPVRFGQKGTRKLQISGVVLKHVESANNEGAESVGKSFRFDMFTDYTKKANIGRMAHLGIACGEVGEWDPDDDAQLVKAITAVPYQIKFSHESFKNKDGKEMKNLRVMEVQQLSQDARKRYVSSPDWKKMIPLVEDRLQEEQDYTTKGGGSGKSEKKQEDPFSDGDDIPGF